MGDPEVDVDASPVVLWCAAEDVVAVNVVYLVRLQRKPSAAIKSRKVHLYFINRVWW